MSETIKCIDFCVVCGKDITYKIPKTMEWKGRKYAEFVRKQLRVQGGDLVDGKRYCAGCVTEMHITRAVRAIEDIHYSRIWMLEKELKQVKRERDAAIQALYDPINFICLSCIHHRQDCDDNDYDCTTCHEICKCKDCDANHHYEWRGVCAENGGVE